MSFVWGLVTQVFSSGANFGLTVIAARLLGPAGLGVVFIGFAAYQLVLGLQRAIVTQPLVAEASARRAAERRRLAGYGATAVLASGLAASVGFATAGLIVGGDIGRGLLVFAPWIVPALLQEFWKALLFQEGRGRPAAMSDGARVAGDDQATPVAATASTRPGSSLSGVSPPLPDDVVLRSGVETSPRQYGRDHVDESGCVAPWAVAWRSRDCVPACDVHNHSCSRGDHWLAQSWRAAGSGVVVLSVLASSQPPSCCPPCGPSRGLSWNPDKGTSTRRRDSALQRPSLGSLTSL